MKYMLSLYGDEAAGASIPPEQMDQIMAAWFAYDAALKEAGVFLAGEALQPTATATSLRIRDGERMLTDGPFAETKEQLGGFYLLECRDLDEALEWAARCPAAHDGTVEVRAVIEFDAPPPGEGASAAAEA
jgi:hypothetical protein